MTTEIDRSDLESKLREIEGVVLDAEENARSRAVLVGVGVGVVVVGLVALSIWRRRNSKIRVEVIKL